VKVTGPLSFSAFAKAALRDARRGAREPSLAYKRGAGTGVGTGVGTKIVGCAVTGVGTGVGTKIVGCSVTGVGTGVGTRIVGAGWGTGVGVGTRTVGLGAGAGAGSSAPHSVWMLLLAFETSKSLPIMSVTAEAQPIPRLNWMREQCPTAPIMYVAIEEKAEIRLSPLFVQSQFALSPHDFWTSIILTTALAIAFMELLTSIAQVAARKCVFESNLRLLSVPAK